MRFLKRFTCFALTSTSIIVAAENGGLPLDLSSTDEINQKAGLPNLIIPSDNSESISLQSSPLSEIVLTPPNNTPNRVPSSDNEEDDKQQEIVENFSNDGSFDEIPLTLDSATSVTKNEDDNSNLINKFDEKSTNGKNLSSYTPHMGLNASPQIYEDWIVAVEQLSSDSSLQVENLTSGDTTITENAEVVSAIVIPESDVNSSTGTLLIEDENKSNDSNNNEGRAISEQVVDPTTTQLPAIATNTTSSPQKTFWTRATHYLNKKWGIGL